MFGNNRLAWSKEPHCRLLLAPMLLVVTISLSDNLAADTSSIDLDIKSQIAGITLMELGQRAGVQIIVPQSIGNRLTLPDIKGEYTLQQALDFLLEGSGLKYEFTSVDVVIIKEGGGEVSVAREEYIAATFSVSLFGFIDDVECRLDTSKNRIHIRSASRVGHSDLGVNKKRAETMIRLFKQKMNEDL